MIMYGKDEESLYKALAQLDRSVGAKAVVNPNEFLTINCQRKGNHLTNFTINQDTQLTKLSKQLGDAVKVRDKALDTLEQMGMKPTYQVWNDVSVKSRVSGHYLCKIWSPSTGECYGVLEYVAPRIINIPDVDMEEKKDPNQMTFNEIIEEFGAVLNQAMQNKIKEDIEFNNTQAGFKSNEMFNLKNCKILKWMPLPIDSGNRITKADEADLSENFNDFLKSLDAEVTTKHELHSVLCLAGIRPTRDKDLKIVTQWFVISPADPYVISFEDKKLDLVTMEYPVTDEEYEYIKETKIAIFDEEMGIIYPLTQQSIVSVGKYLDAVASFKNVMDIPFSEACLIANKLYYVPKTQFIYRNLESTDKIKPLIGMAGKDFNLMNMMDFYQNCRQRVNQLVSSENSANTQVIDWEFENDVIRVDYKVMFSKYISRFQPIIRIENSLTPGCGVTLHMLVRFGDNQEGHMELGKNTLYHNVECDYDKLFAGVKETYDNLYQRIYDDPKVIIDSNDLNGLIKIIGKDRASKTNFFTTQHVGFFTTLMGDMINLTYVNDFGRKQQNDLAKEYRNIAENILKKNLQE